MGKRVLVVGGGPSGLVTAKEMRAAGHEVRCIEKSREIGGVFGMDKEAPNYDSLMLTTSNYFMAFSDFPPRSDENMRYWTKREYGLYLHDYVKKFGIVVELNTELIKAEFVTEKNIWKVSIRQLTKKRSFLSNGGYLDTVEDFDALCLATGSNHVPHMIDCGTFSGIKMHSSSYKENSIFKDKSVLIIGSGESAADIGPEIAEVAKTCTMWTRREPTFAPRFPALMAGEKDHDEYRVLTTPAEAAKCQLPDFLEYMTTPRVQNEASLALLALNKQQYFDMVKNDKQASPQSKLSLRLVQRATRNAYYRADQALWVTKNGRPLVPIIQGKLHLVVAPRAEFFASDAVRLDECTRIDLNEFDPPEKLPCHTIQNLDAIVLCTGYEVPDFNKILIAPIPIESNPRTWYKHCFPPGFQQGQLAFFGFARGQQGGIPQMAELLARYHALILAGQRTLPINYDRLALLEGRQEHDFFCLSPDLNALVDYPAFCDSLATLIGCKPQPPLAPLRFLQYWTFPLWPYWYRHHGPGATPHVLDDVLSRFPLYSKGLACSRKCGAKLFFGMFPFTIIGIIQALLQKPISILTCLLLPSTIKKPGLSRGWMWLKPKHFVLHGNQLSLKAAVVAS